MTTTTTFAVIGMTCGHCVSSITRALTDLEGFVSVDVTLVPDGASQVTLISQEPVALPEIATLIDEEGYQVAWC